MLFNIGDTVLCKTDNGNINYRLTPGKYYTILKDNNSLVIIKNDLGKLASFWSGRFDNTQNIRDIKLKLILGIE
jgi:hypothetical protein